MQALWHNDEETLPLINVGPTNSPLWGINISVNGRDCIGLIDNCCADYCYATSEFAANNGITPLDYKLKINKKEDGYIGIADSIVMGGLVLRNILFVVSDINKSLSESYTFDIIIGSNIMRAVEDIIINNVDRTITFSRSSMGYPQNLFISSGSHTYYTDVFLNDEQVKLLLDFGCSRTHMSRKYYSDRRDVINNNYLESEIAFAQISHSEKSKSYIIGRANFIVCGKNCEMNNIHIQRSSRSTDWLEGSLGVDMLRKFRIVKFNAAKLYLLLSDYFNADEDNNALDKE